MPNNIDRRKLTDKEKEIVGIKCANCGSKKDLKYHHIVPLAVGGSNLLTNFVCLCDICHKAVHGKNMDISFGKLGMEKKERLPPFDIELFANLSVLYYNRGITKGAMAKQLGISRPTLDNWLNKNYYQKAKKIIEELNDQYFVISVEDGYFDKVSDKEMKEYLKAKQRLEGGYYKDEE